MISESDILIEYAKTLYGKDKNAYTYIGWEGTEATALQIDLIQESLAELHAKK